MKIKDKTRLRHLLLRCQGTLSEWNLIEFARDGSWEVLGTRNSYSDYRPLQLSIHSLLYRYNETYPLRLTRNQIITRRFHEVEQHITKVLELD